MPYFKVSVEDFYVEEIPLWRPGTVGQHTYLCLEKRNLTTEEVALRLAESFAVTPQSVGFAGRKDRYARTRQWFSIPVEKTLDEVAMAIENEHLHVLEVATHSHRLRLGELRGNRFEIRVREVSREQAIQARASADSIASSGMQNRFGQQRFGVHGDNAVRGLELLRGDERSGPSEGGSGRSSSGREVRRASRHSRFLISAVQSELFHRYLKERELMFRQAGSETPFWSTVVDGDVVWDDVLGVDRWFVSSVLGPQANVEPLAPTGPLFGPKMRRPRGQLGVIESAILAGAGIEVEAFEPYRMQGGRRRCGVRVGAIELDYDDSAETLTARFSLPPGSYATVLLEQLFIGNDLREGAAGREAGNSSE